MRCGAGCTTPISHRNNDIRTGSKPPSRSSGVLLSKAICSCQPGAISPSNLTACARDLQKISEHIAEILHTNPVVNYIMLWAFSLPVALSLMCREEQVQRAEMVIITWCVKWAPRWYAGDRHHTLWQKSDRTFRSHKRKLRFVVAETFID